MWHVRRKKKNTFGFLWGNQKEIDYLERRHTWVVNIKMDRNEIRLEVLDWINLARYWKKWRALVKWVKHFRVLQNAPSPWLAKELLAPQEELYSVELILKLVNPGLSWKSIWCRPINVQSWERFLLLVLILHTALLALLIYLPGKGGAELNTQTRLKQQEAIQLVTEPRMLE